MASRKQSWISRLKIALNDWLMPLQLAKPRTSELILKILIVAGTYAITAKLSLVFAALPGNITAVWLPSGFTLAFVTWFGLQVVPGIALGSVVFMVSNSLTMPLSWPVFSDIVAIIACSLANSIQPVIGLGIIHWLTQKPPRLDRMKTVLAFVVAAVIAPMLPALIGITTSALVGIVPWSNYGISWFTWWSAGVAAILVFTPTLLFWSPQAVVPLYLQRRQEVMGVCGLTLGLCWLIFGQGYPVEYVLLLVLIWSRVRLGNFATSVLVSLIAIVAIVSTAHRFGAFAGSSTTASLIILQSFITVCSVSGLVLGGTLDTQKAVELSLEKTLESLEQQVSDRTAQLRESQAILDGFFSVAPVGLGIVDQDLRYVRINPLMAAMHNLPVESHLGRSIREIEPDLASDLESVYCQVLRTGQPILNREENNKIQHPDNPEKTWLATYFPIVNLSQKPTQVGVILMEISEIKQLERQLRKQAYMDGLTQVANRLYFNETLELEWRRCGRSGQPLSMVLTDLDDFKAYNDTYGHPVGDECLKQFARVLTQAISRPSDLVARYGGEEFVVVLPETNAIGALQVAERIRQSLHHLQIPHCRSSVAPYATVSLGIATCIPSLQQDSDFLLQAADKALYESKRQGRDRITQIDLDQTTNGSND